MICVEHYYFSVVFIGVSGQVMRKETQSFEFGPLPFKRVKGTIVLKAPDGRKMDILDNLKLFHVLSYIICNSNVRLEVFTALSMKTAILWDVTPCCLVHIYHTWCHIPENSNVVIQTFSMGDYDISSNSVSQKSVNFYVLSIFV
jgi:hypothetical protein